VSRWRLAAAIALTAAAGCQTPGAESSLSVQEQQIRSYFLDPSGEAADDVTAARIAAAENLTAGCMKREGFEYSPAPPELRFGRGTASDPNDPEFAAEWGFGISMLAFPESMQPIPDDPNEDYVASLTPNDRRAYEAALQGTEQNEFQDGCVVVSARQASADLGLDDAVTAIREVEEAVESDDAVGAARAEWALCMQAEGFEAASPDELQRSLYDDWNELQSAGEITPEMAEGFRSEEIAAAQTSLNCGESLRTATRAAQQRALQAISPDYEGLLDD
jgi:hypothetical protein